jgi:glutathione-specific gamma-glutamylcyclotransferase
MNAGQAAEPLWVFAYGSLIWRPGFAYEEAARARLNGLHRALCIYSTHYRGTFRRPGLVFGLEPGGQCEGIAYRIAPARAAETIAYLNARELITGVYVTRHRSLQLTDGSHRTVRALCYVANRVHPQYAMGLGLAEQARLVGGSRGASGSNLDYVLSTLRQLRALGIHDPHLERMVTLMRAHGELRRGALHGAHDHLRAVLRRYPCGVAPSLPRTQMLRANHRRHLGL